MSALATNSLNQACVNGAGVDDLMELIRSFNDVSEQLQSTHLQLQQQVARLQTELAEANAQLRRSRSLAALGEMAAGIAHEVRNPLGSIQLYAQMLGEDLADRPAQHQTCVKIRQAVEHLDAIVRDVLTFARDMKIRPVETTADELLTRALSSCESLLAGGEVDVACPTHAGESIAIHADEILLVQALSNIIRNAVEAMVESKCQPRRLTANVSRGMRRRPDGTRAQRIVFSFEDTGPGIPEDVVQRMFNPFFTTRATGTGLGLAIVHRIVDAHGGHISVGPASKGAGARIEICLPLRPPKPEQAVPALHLAARSSDLSSTPDMERRA